MSKSKTINSIELTGHIPEVIWAKFDNMEALYADNKELMNENKELRIENNQLKIENMELKNEISAPYSIKGMCTKLGISETTLYTYREEGLIDCCTLGQKVWFTEEHLQDFLRKTDSRYKPKLKKAE